MAKLNEETLTELWESVGEEPSRFVSADEVKLTGSVRSLDLEFSSEAPLAYEMVVRGYIEPHIKKEEEVMEDRLYKFSEIIRMLEEGELPEGTKIYPNEWNGGNCTIIQGAYGLGIVKDSDDTFGELTSWVITSLYKIEKPSPKRYKALHKAFTDYSVKPFRLFQRTDGSITLLSSFLDNGNKNTFTMEELEAFPINLNDFNLEEVSTTV